MMHRHWPKLLLPALLLEASALAQAAPPENADPTLAPWFQSLQRPDIGGSCCSLADCRRVRSRLAGKGFEIMLDGVWVPVPPERIIYRDNPTGEAVACTRSHVVICFVPGPET
ncbi:MAG TPA: hypothetical protein VFA50_20685 [Stellaceae bacterium]|nr:hypothetical protein [Stellaceae bacterium]